MSMKKITLILKKSFWFQRLHLYLSDSRDTHTCKSYTDWHSCCRWETYMWCSGKKYRINIAKNHRVCPNGEVEGDLSSCMRPLRIIMRTLLGSPRGFMSTGGALLTRKKRGRERKREKSRDTVIIKKATNYFHRSPRRPNVRTNTYISAPLTAAYGQRDVYVICVWY